MSDARLKEKLEAALLGEVAKHAEQVFTLGFQLGCYASEGMSAEQAIARAKRETNPNIDKAYINALREMILEGSKK